MDLSYTGFFKGGEHLNCVFVPQHATVFDEEETADLSEAPFELRLPQGHQ